LSFPIRPFLTAGLTSGLGSGLLTGNEGHSVFSRRVPAIETKAVFKGAFLPKSNAVQTLFSLISLLMCMVTEQTALTRRPPLTSSKKEPCQWLPPIYLPIPNHASAVGKIPAWLHSNRCRTRHGWVNTKLAKVFDGMKARCHVPHCAGYRYYRARGITVCEEWLADRGEFFKWAEENGYAEGLQIDRKENHLGYSPDNCRWVTQLVN